jgi:hypothetical protein
MKRITLSLLAVAFLFVAIDLARAERFVGITGAITDNETGLMWLSRPCCIHGYWKQSDPYNTSLTNAGFDDWRTPTLEELQVLMEGVRAADRLVFSDVQPFYWSTTEGVVFNISDSSTFYDPASPYWIWPVRTAFIPEQPVPDPGENCLTDSFGPSGSVHAYDNMLWSPKNKMEVVTLEGYLRDPFSIARDGGGNGISTAYLLVGGTEKMILKGEGVNLLGEDGTFSLDIEVLAEKEAVYSIELYATDTNEEPNTGLVDSTHIRVPHDMGVGKSGKKD